ncbi:hypothetical protein D1AOALGA4SA_5568 [Olavius algarvensis Delta 1 endosymbiont]|nr:hypothetical protein D1AOALGA4SA_5568 [Olavius algarvensis Delta 1 endosymbiont]
MVFDFRHIIYRSDRHAEVIDIAVSRAVVDLYRHRQRTIKIKRWGDGAGVVAVVRPVQHKECKIRRVRIVRIGHRQVIQRNGQLRLLGRRQIFLVFDLRHIIDRQYRDAEFENLAVSHAVVDLHRYCQRAVKIKRRRDGIAVPAVVLPIQQKEREIRRVGVVRIDNRQIVQRNGQLRLLGRRQIFLVFDLRHIIDRQYRNAEVKNLAVSRAVVDLHRHGQRTVKIKRWRDSAAVATVVLPIQHH